MKKTLWILAVALMTFATSCDSVQNTNGDATSTEPAADEMASEGTGNELMDMYLTMHDTYDALHGKMESAIKKAAADLKDADEADKQKRTLKLGSLQKLDERLHLWHKAYENINMGEGSGHKHDHDHGDHDHSHDHSGGGLKLYEFPEGEQRTVLSAVKSELDKLAEELAAAVQG